MMIRQQIPQGSHPIEQGQYILPTREIHRLMEALKQNISNHSPGMVVYGRPRLGKTKAVEFILRVLPLELGNPIPIFSTHCRSYRMPSDTSFFEDMLSDFKFALPAKRKSTELRKQIVNLFLLNGEKSRLRRVVLIMDEAHRLTEWHYTWLMDIYNELDREKISMTVISVGQEELLLRRDHFLRNKKSQIIGRFMTQEHAYYGIRSIADMEFCLESYDDATEFPIGSGWNFTRYFFPEAFSEGERLKSSACTLMEQFQEIRREYSLPKEIEIPMEYFAFTVENALKIYGANGKGHHWLNASDWREAIKLSGYIESEIYMALA